MQTIEFTVNGRRVSGACADRTHLGDYLRDTHRLTGTHLGCEHGVCGACTVLVDDKPVRSCITFAAACQGADIVTVEGYEDDPVMADLRAAFNRHHALQCGYCTPGMLATARDIVVRLPDADEATIRHELSGNLCRCTGYMGIVAAIRSVLDARRAAAGVIARHAGAAAAPLPFAGFTVADEALGTQPHLAAAGSAEPERSADRKGWSRIEGGFAVPYALDQVWAFMADLPAVAGCLPGAVLTEVAGDKVKGHIAIKFGPMSARFEGAARLQRDDANKRGVLKGAGQDSLSNSKAAGDIAYALKALSAGETEVEVDLQYSLQGPLAQFSRSGLVRDFVRRMIADFGKAVSRRMDPTLSEAERNQAVRLNPVTMFFGVLWERMKRLFGAR
ncbi:2Fe-2S iron-sulfur cluster-binding protein [Cupriavidus taiwanensis]|uniref:Aerobic-type carbon monoxide dehydrogenase homolog subunits S and G n=1 Tax=Cupriavidus taiwanensis TaxID=164546 RepID=A0A375IPS8_9BURK|nr:2Fe-2S iron-sulfur cluster-binding protein [Cupriavidus taiwanensis]SOZ30790.1 Aerobic-type carbon monoxide dehydrogenase homolog subunits S and G [Cupriavidus taiwanensis]SPA35505.1 Aerobic-type carbon monoxide dehydrogenase homolog subunits S and G [Cupriavidus taiwanensis]SPK75472.1 Aerobic-type carbon monoxide dehydrogenase homolog subunits S and G [Cupriavidus taiwanensis]